MPSLAGFDSFGSFMRGKGAAQAEQDRVRQLQRDEEDRAYQLERRPIEAQQKDDAHALNMRNVQQSMGIRASQEGRSAALDQMRMQMAELGLDDAKLQRDQRNFAAKIGGPARRFAMTGDTKGISAAFREVTGGEGELVRKDDGSYAISSPEGETPIGTRNDVIRVLSTFSQSPEAYLNLQYQIATGAGRAGSAQPANVREIEYIAERMPRLEGESDQDHFMRAAEFVKRTGVRDPEVEFRSLMLKIMEGQRAATGKVDRDAALEEARYIMGQKLSPRQQGGGERRATGRTQDDPIDVSTLSSRPPPGTWVRLPDGNVAQVPN